MEFDFTLLLILFEEMKKKKKRIKKTKEKRKTGLTVQHHTTVRSKMCKITKSLNSQIRWDAVLPRNSFFENINTFRVVSNTTRPFILKITQHGRICCLSIQGNFLFFLSLSLSFYFFLFFYLFLFDTFSFSPAPEQGNDNGTSKSGEPKAYKCFPSARRR